MEQQNDTTKQQVHMATRMESATNPQTIAPKREKSTDICTYKHVMMNPLDPQEGDILIEDIAHALSLMTRAGGHFPEFYSVAQHCCDCCEEAIGRGYDKRVILACLLHDGAEAYVADLTRPVKRQLPEYSVIESRLLNTIYRTFLGSELTEEEAELVKDVDDSLLFHEFRHFMGMELNVPHNELVTTPYFGEENRLDVEAEYLKLYEQWR